MVYGSMEGSRVPSKGVLGAAATLAVNSTGTETRTVSGSCHVPLYEPSSDRVEGVRAVEKLAGAAEVPAKSRV